VAGKRRQANFKLGPATTDESCRHYLKLSKQKVIRNCAGITPTGNQDTDQEEEVKKTTLTTNPMAGRAEVDAKRNELLHWKGLVADTYAEYKTQADLRIARQREMAQLVQLVQQSQKQAAANDIPLVEDVILASLWAETRALQSQQLVPDKPVIDPANQPQGMTKSAEEAIAVYSSQIEVLIQDRQYRQAMLDNEASMANELGAGLTQIERIVRDYCQNQSLRDQVLELMQKGG
jgi:hypothetical protein